MIEATPDFEVLATRKGCWRVRSLDGRIGGLFVNLAAAIKFMREEREQSGHIDRRSAAG